MTSVPFTPDVDAIVEGLRSSPIHVDPSLADEFTPEQLATIKSSIESSPVPVHVIAIPLSHQSDLSPVQLISLVHRKLPEDGIWYVTLESYQGRWGLETTTYGVSVENTNALASYVGRELYPTDLALQLGKVTELIANGTAKTTYVKTFPDRPSPTGVSQQPDGDPFLGVGWPVVGVGVGVLALLVAAVTLRRRRARSGEVAVKGRALRRIGAAQTQAWHHRARTATDQLGERINTHQIAPDSDREAWTAALDHYDAASRVLDGKPSAADSIGALVLAERGDDALDHAIAGTPWEPQVMCFFNPLHGNATVTARWRTAAGTRDVPCCSACRKAVSRKREPDFLDLPVGDTVVHYVDADDSAEPWASTGYGALEPDLLSHLSR